MNNLLRVKLKFTPEKRTNGFSDRNFTSDRYADIEKIDELIDSLNSVKAYYKTQTPLLKHALIDIRYNDIIAKSNRVRELLKGRKAPDNTIVGARFSDAEPGFENHIITHYVEFFTIDSTIQKLNFAKRFLAERLEGRADKKNFNKPKAIVSYDGYEYKETKIRDIIIDCSVIERFDVPGVPEVDVKESMLVTFYQTELRISDVLEKIGLNEPRYRYSLYGDSSITVDAATFNKIRETIPYLISMVATDISTLQPLEKQENRRRDSRNIPKPTTEPTIGVIDTLFDESVYFSEWVEYEEVLDFFEHTQKKASDYEHGTEVTSLIVDGPALNPTLDDGCGRFKVKHFAVCCDRISPSRLMRKIIKIVDDNPQIHVWNLSLGTEEEVSKNFVSFDASILDEIQSSKNVIFVIAGTNDNTPQAGIRKRIGSPADSLNSIVVNSVKRNNKPCSYSRKGQVLSFFNKPDVSYYGGDVGERIAVYSPKGTLQEKGTSFAAPWISRKLCYLIDVMGLPREVAKALIIDAAAGWEYKQGAYKNKDLIGYGVVPIKINDILSCDNSEIRFVIYETSKSYKTANYAIPVPKDKEDKYPYIARATLCYFPKCQREQGVDYTDRELSLKFGKVGSKGTIEDINKNVQDDNDGHANERKSRQEFRKWENTKFVSSLFHNNRALKSFDDKLWGFCVTSKERRSQPLKEELNFGAVVTLREIKGVNRIEEFKHACLLRGYIVTKLEVHNQIEIYETSQEEVVFQ